MGIKKKTGGISTSIALLIIKFGYIAKMKPILTLAILASVLILTAGKPRSVKTEVNDGILINKEDFVLSKLPRPVQRHEMEEEESRPKFVGIDGRRRKRGILLDEILNQGFTKNIKTKLGRKIRTKKHQYPILN